MKLNLLSLARATLHAVRKARYGSRRIERGSGRDLYRTRFGDLFWLTPTSYLDRCIIDSGMFEEQSTNVVTQLVKSGSVVLDVGANIGYYTVLLSKLVGPTGRVLSFEPTAHFRRTLEQNVSANRLTNVEILPFGLSNRRQQLEIEIGESSATLHSPNSSDTRAREVIDLTTLDDFIAERRIERVDFIKIDVDGHEPHFLEGGWQAIKRLSPKILLEVSHLNYFQAGIAAWDFFDSLKANGFHIYHEDGLVEIVDKNVFLVRCANFAFSTNIVISQQRLEGSTKGRENG